MMPIIEGIGDEVVQFACAVLLITVSTLAWWSTNARPERYRTVLLLGPHAQRPVNVSIYNGGVLSWFTTTSRSALATINTSPEVAAVTLNSPGTIAMSETRTVISLQEMDSIIDADVALLNDSRMHFYRRLETTTPAQREETSDSEVEDLATTETASTEQMREMDSIVNAMRGDVNAPCFTHPGGDNNSNPAPGMRVSNGDQPAINTTDQQIDPEEVNARKILIKLKYLNETQKEVEGSLDELLKDFKCRHFSKELTERRAVRLIYQGRVLEEARTLRACGLHHRAVVHALVHPHRAHHAHPHPHPHAHAQPHTGAEASIGAPLEIIHERAQTERAWDLENILMTLVSVALTVIWFFRCEYANMFTASASVALFGLTVFYSVAIFGLYISDTFQIDRRQQPVPNN